MIFSEKIKLNFSVIGNLIAYVSLCQVAEANDAQYLHALF